ncbi:unnamed protein product [Bursaphelenchus xylophilus]|uniref:(pine wood nematode) hypothetical protein n=1 Tax=Bursaphelenchus xylophilus TaxID=6326 RepID=A0A1I7SVE5_BURXY|nr:unnamed protein product [Bursaphelenchus xylophilus]CAG9101330.1 unnamed protein product [Bursaphelenchus xylophilus]
MTRLAALILLAFPQFSSACWSTAARTQMLEMLPEKFDHKAPNELKLFGNKRFIKEFGVRAIYQLFFNDPNLSKHDPPGQYLVNCAVQPSGDRVRLIVNEFFAAFNTSLGRIECEVAIVDESKQQISEFSEKVSKTVLMDMNSIADRFGSKHAFSNAI